VSWATVLDIPEQNGFSRRISVRRLLLTASAFAMLSGVAFAQTSNSGSASNATNSSGSQSSAVSNPRATVTGNSVGNGASSSTSGAKSVANTRSSSGASANPTLVSKTATNVYIDQSSGGSGGSSGGASGASEPTTTNLNERYSGSYTVRNTPQVSAPNVLGGNACAVGASGGLALPGFGITAGTTWADKACERRQQAALLFNMGELTVARELMCQDDQVRKAMQAGGKPCVVDTVVAQAAPATAPRQAAQAIPAALVVPPIKTAAIVPAVVPAANPPAKAVPAWCGKATPSTEASKAYVAQACS
jgi:hypothetical protein